MHVYKSIRRRAMASLVGCSLLWLSAIVGCSEQTNSPTSPPSEPHSQVGKIIQPPPPGTAGGSYGGPGDTVPAANCDNGQTTIFPLGPVFCDVCNHPFTVPIAQLAPPLTLGNSVDRGLFTAYCTGSLNGYHVISFPLTLQDYQQLLAAQATDADGNYTIRAFAPAPSQQIYYFEHAKLNGTFGGSCNSAFQAVKARVYAYDSTHSGALGVEIVHTGAFKFIAHVFGSAPANCGSAVGAITFNKACLDAAIAWHIANGTPLNPSSVLFEISFLTCSSDI